MKFKLGDRVISSKFKGVKVIVCIDVRCGSFNAEYVVGSLCVGPSIRDGFISYWESGIEVGNFVVTNLNFHNESWIHTDHLKLAQIRNNKLARKLYPNYKIIDKNWLEVV